MRATYRAFVREYALRHASGTLPSIYYDRLSPSSRTPRERVYGHLLPVLTISFVSLFQPPEGLLIFYFSSCTSTSSGLSRAARTMASCSSERTVRLLPRYRVPGLNELWLFDKKVPHREVQGVPAPFDTHAEHVIVHEVAVEHELDGLRTAE